MKSKGFSFKLFEDNSEAVNYTEENLPIRSVISVQEDYPTLCVVNHWHNDFEFSYVIKGHMFYSVNGECIELNEGDVIFVNSARMHYGYWSKKEECKFLCVLFRFEILSSVPEKIIAKMAGSDAPPYLVFHRADAGYRDITDRLTDLNNICEQKDDGYELSAVSLCCAISNGLFRHCTVANEHSVGNSRKLFEFHEMIGYIQGHYSEKMSLADISAAGSVCRSRCFELFKEYIGKTPFEYLNEYRISKSLDMLKNKNMNITEIALQCGFCSSSYFAEVFRKFVGISPKQFQNK